MQSRSTWPSIGIWHFGAAEIALAALTVGVFVVLDRRQSGPARWSVLAAGALGVLLLSSDIQATAMENYRSHMIEHLAVILIIAPLLASATSMKWSKQLSTFSFLAFASLVPLFHLTRLGGIVMRSPLGHDVELLSFLLVGVIFWLPVYGMGRQLNDRQRITYVLLATPIIATTGLVLWSSSISSLSITSMNMAMVSLPDVHGGGLVMMVWGSAGMLSHLFAVTLNSAVEFHRHRRPIGQRYA